MLLIENTLKFNDFSRIIIFLLFIAVKGQTEFPLGKPEQCQYTFTVTEAAFKDSCKTAEIEGLLDMIKAERNQFQSAKEDIEKNLKTLQSEFKLMVDTVNKLKNETQSWREVIEWPNIDNTFEPVNSSMTIDKENSYQDCWEAIQKRKKHGIFNIKPKNALRPFLGFCDEDGWTVIQRRFDGTTSFYRKFDEYAMGFGKLSGEFWLGNENLHLITSQDHYELKAELLGWNNKLYSSTYSNFSVGSESEDYLLKVGNMSAGNFLDVLSEKNGTGFSTHDVDNDNWGGGNCAQYYKGGFWINSCTTDPNRELCEGSGCMTWGRKSIKKSLLKIRSMNHRNEDNDQTDQHGEEEKIDGKRRESKAGRRNPLHN